MTFMFNLQYLNNNEKTLPIHDYHNSSDSIITLSGLI
jgi:hypothetical protein